MGLRRRDPRQRGAVPAARRARAPRAARLGVPRRRPARLVGGRDPLDAEPRLRRVDRPRRQRLAGAVLLSRQLRRDRADGALRALRGASARLWLDGLRRRARRRLRRRRLPVRAADRRRPPSRGTLLRDRPRLPARRPAAARASSSASSALTGWRPGRAWTADRRRASSPPRSPTALSRLPGRARHLRRRHAARRAVAGLALLLWLRRLAAGRAPGRRGRRACARWSLPAVFALAGARRCSVTGHFARPQRPRGRRSPPPRCWSPRSCAWSSRSARTSACCAPSRARGARPTRSPASATAAR